MSAFDSAVGALLEAVASWNRGATPGLVSRAAVLFEDSVRQGDPRGDVGSAVSRGLAGDIEGARRRLFAAIARRPERASGYVALGLFGLRDRDPLAHAAESAWALTAARDLCPGVGCIERLLAQALAAEGEFMGALQCARTAMSLDRDDQEARLWSGLLRLYFGGDLSAASVLADFGGEDELRGRSSALWLAAAAGLYARADFLDARKALRCAVAPLRPGNAAEAALIDSSKRWFRELRGFGPGVAMAPDRWLRDVGGPQSDYARTRASLATFREALQADPSRARQERVSPLEVDGALGALEARTRRAMLEWAARLLIRGFAEAYLPLVAYFEAPPIDVLAAMDLVVCDG